MKREYTLYLKDMLENIEKANYFIENLTYEDFKADERTNFAVIRCLEIVGEASKSIPKEIKSKYNDIPWKDIAGLRDKIVHGYSEINLFRVWLVVKEDFPILKEEIENIMKDLGIY
ncbi:MAG TPA: DUF86 domain-containing protein [Methanofastidiosum sp.]|nr:DUF86 domain-containing protein [Candidatus Methanofastidiosa archaeon]HOE92425.1 DUF86 domain-containing protein [Methanofastidiosum sp.]HPC80930.1 DUF86 domain-containing protein [Methanofastidiosum sp.]HPL00217.1 DUF86 domain-containing protein [Methanofastidiosum sp.]HRS26100.1 DUF86 domain-containing protein [Methanofastidiosum sp.]